MFGCACHLRHVIGCTMRTIRVAPFHTHLFPLSFQKVNTFDMKPPPPLLPLVSIAIANILPISFMPSLNMHDASRHALQPQNYIMLSLRVQLPKGTLVPSPTATSIVSAHSARGGTHQTLISGTQSADMHSQVNHVSIVCASPRREMDEWANKSTSAASGCLQCYA